MSEDAAYRNALKRRGELLEKIESQQRILSTLEIERSKVDQFLNLWREFAGLPADGPQHEIFAHKAESPPLTRSPRVQGNTRKEDVASFARDIINEAGRPVARNDMLNALLELGAVINGVDRGNVLGTMLHRSPQSVVRLEGHGYWIPEKPYEPAGWAASRFMQDPETGEFRYEPLKNPEVDDLLG